MEILKIIATSLGSIIILFVLAKLMGNKQLSQLSTFDYINGITIGSIAAEMATSIDGDFWHPLIAMVIYAIAAIAISVLTTKSIILRRFFTGTSLVLLNNGKVYKDNLAKAKLDTDEFLTQCRNSGYFNISDLETAVMETNGKISFLPKSSKRPANPDDFGIYTNEEKIIPNVVQDGKIMEENLKTSGKNVKWLEKKFREQGITEIKNVFLATIDSENSLNVYLKIPNEPQKNVLS